MSRRETVRWWSIGLLAVAIAIIAVAFKILLNRPKVRATSHAISLSEYRTTFGHEELPDSACNIWYARSSVGLGGGASLYRFDAPVADCQAYARCVIKRAKDTAETSREVPAELTPLSAAPQAVNHTLLKDFYGMNTSGWFDVENIRDGWDGRGPPSGFAHIWIDAERGRFYYYWTD